MAGVKKILTIVGARPQFVKAAAVSAALRERADLAEVLVHTGQHYDRELSGAFFDDLGLPAPAHDLQVGSGDHGAQTGRMLLGLERILLDERPDRVLVYGDTNSTLAGALTAAKLGIRLAHVEGGMRSFNRAMPEEINRVVTDHLADLHLCVNRTAVENLDREGVRRGVHVVGDVMYDACLGFGRLAEARHDPLARLGLTAGGYLLVTCHRPENTDDPANLAAILRALEALGRRLAVLFPLHPRTAAAMDRAGLKASPALRLVKPTGYLETLVLQRKAAVILTDSGGMQKEALFHGVPCVTMRRETEWPETVAAGWNVLTGPDERAIVSAVERFLGRRPEGNPAAELYGQGRAAGRIAALLAEA